jgi:hypothetical protein
MSADAKAPTKSHPFPPRRPKAERWLKATSLLPREQRFVAEYQKSGRVEQSAILAGYPRASARSRGSELLNFHPLVKAELEKGRAALRREAHFGMVEAFAGLDEALAFAKDTGNATAAVRVWELKAKLAGLLDQRDQTAASSFAIHINGLGPAPTPVVEVSAATPIAHDDNHDDTA